MSLCHHRDNYISPCSIPNTADSTASCCQKSLAPLNANDYHLHIRFHGPGDARATTGGIMRTRQDIWLDWAARILITLGVTAIAAGSVLIAWMSLEST